MTKAERETERLAACGRLRQILKPGMTVYTVLRNGGARGATSRVDLFTIKHGQLLYLTYSVALAAEYPRHRETGQISTTSVSDIVYNLGCALWPNGFKLPKGKIARHNEKPGRESDGGYALRHETL